MNDEVVSYFKKKKDIYEHILEFIESTENNDEFDFMKLIDLLNSQELEPSLRLILSITNNHKRDGLFFNKIEKIFLNLEDQIKQKFSNYELYNIFISNKRILLFLFHEKIIVIDELIKKSILSMFDQNGIQYCHFFLPEIKSMIDEAAFKIIQCEFNEQELDRFDEKRQVGENDSYICELIRNDSIDEFVTYLNRTNISHSSKIERSIFETNSYLIENEPTLIEYAAFYGSIQIFNYLRFNGVELNSNLWLYSIHSKNAELIHILEMNQIPPPNESYESCLIESIKCHHNDLANYIENTKPLEICIEKVDEASFKYYNYEYLPKNILDKDYLFFYLVSNKFNEMVEIWLKSKKDEIQNITETIQKSEIIRKIKRTDIIYNSLSICRCVAEHKFFNNCVIKQLVIPSSVKSIESYAFKGCELLEQIIIPSSVEEIYEDAFYGCSSLKQITIPSSVAAIGKAAFFGCSSLENVMFEIPSSLESIRRYTFIKCVKLRQIIIPSPVQCIHDSFTECSSLTYVSIPSSVRSLGEEAFRRCTSLKQVFFERPSSLYTIFNYCFIECYSLTNIKFPSSLKSFGDFVFFDTPIKNVSFDTPSSLTKINKFNFSNCSSLEQITIPSSVTEIECGSFRGCSSLKIISISSSITEIDVNVFYGCSSLEEIEIPSSVTSIKLGAFRGCSSLEQILIPSSVTKISRNVFRGCKSLKRIEIPSSVTKINEATFRGCSSLASIMIPSSVTEIKSHAFNGCFSLLELNIPNSVISIGDYAFQACSSLKQITIPSSVSSIGKNAFRGCTSLEQITILSSQIEIEESAFPNTAKIIRN